MFAIRTNHVHNIEYPTISKLQTQCYKIVKWSSVAQTFNEKEANTAPQLSLKFCCKRDVRENEKKIKTKIVQNKYKLEN